MGKRLFPLFRCSTSIGDMRRGSRLIVTSSSLLVLFANTLNAQISSKTANLGALTLQPASIVETGAGSSVPVSANTSAITWSSPPNVYIDTNPPVAGNGSVYFGHYGTGFSSTQLAEIASYGNGPMSSGTAMTQTGSEVSPMPEPGTYAAGVLALVALCYNQRRRFKRLLARA